MPTPIVYTRTTCAPCKMLKTWMQRKGIEYVERNVDDDPSAAQEAYDKSGFMMVPVTVIGDRVITGPNVSLLSSILMV